MYPYSMSYLRYSPSVEQPQANESAVFEELSRTMQHITRTMAGHYRHAYRPVHAKSHGVLVGTLNVHSNLAGPLAQGLFANPGSYPVILRFSTNPGDLLADSVSSPRGLAIKILNVPGEMVPSHAGKTTQDLVCVNAKAFGAPDPAGFLAQIKLLDKTLEYPEGVKQAVSTVARGTNTILRAIGIHSGSLDNIGHPFTHILGETFCTIAPIRYGDYVAKLAVVPSSGNLKELTDKHIDAGHGFNPLEDLIKDFFRTETASWQIQAQLALDNETTPIEDASKQWPEDKSPYQAVATITVSPQESYSNARQIFVDEQLSFSPWHALAAHQPLGGIMRSRRVAYEEAQKFRAERNLRLHVEPSSVEEVPA
jgi:catalase